MIVTKQVNYSPTTSFIKTIRMIMITIIIMMIIIIIIISIIIIT